MTTDIAALRALAAAATPGPWKTVQNPMRSDGLFVMIDAPQEYYEGVSDINGNRMPRLPDAVVPCQVDHDSARYIAAANPAAILSLLAELEAARKIITVMRAHPSWMNGQMTMALTAYDAAVRA